MALSVSVFANSPAVGPTLPKPGATAKPVATIAKPAVTTAKKTTARPVAQKTSSAKKTSAKKPVAKKASTQKTSSAGFGPGSKGAAVLEVQELLQALNYDITEPDGQFGDQTSHAVMAFQKANGLSRTARVGSQTLAALKDASISEAMMPDGGPDRVEVDLKRQIMMIWKNDELFKVISISSGNNKDFCAFDPETDKTECDKAVTPTGSFRIQRRWVGWRESKLGELYNPLYFTGGFALHGSLSVPSYPASHGCVRVPMVSAEWLPAELPDGTALYIFPATDAGKQPTPLKPKAAPATKPGASTVPGGSTIPGATVPATVATTTSTTTTTIATVRLLPDGSVPSTLTSSTLSSSTLASTTVAPSTAATTVGPVATLPLTSTP
jgi:hypothetical protein